MFIFVNCNELDDGNNNNEEKKDSLSLFSITIMCTKETKKKL